MSRSIPELIAMLDDPSWQVRRQVVEALAGGGEPAALALCHVLTGDRKSETALAAALDALSAMPGDGTDRLLELTRDPDPAVVVDAAQALGRRRSLPGLPRLVELVRHEDDNVALAAIEGLGRIGGSTAVEALVGAVRSRSFFRTFPAIDALARSGDPRAVPPLVELLDDPRYAREATRALGRSGDRLAVRPLLRAPGQHGQAFVRVAALALAELEDRHRERFGIDGILSEELGSGPRPRELVRSLLQALEGAHGEEQVAIIRVLGALQAEAALSRLQGLLDAEPAVAGAAAEALARTGGPAAATLLEALQAGSSERRRALLPRVAARKESLPAVLACLDDPEAEVRAAAAELLGRIGDPAAVGALFRLLDDPSPLVVQAAVGAIQALGSEEARDLALDQARQGSARIRRSALRILGWLGQEGAYEELASAVRHDPDPLVRETATHELGSLEEERATALLLELLESAPGRQQAAAARALGRKAPHPEVIGALRRHLADPQPWVRYHAAASLGRLGAVEAQDELQQLLLDEAPQVRVAAVEALARLPGDRPFQALKGMLESSDPDVRRAALIGLGLSGRREARPLLEQALSDADPSTRLVVLSALERLPGGADIQALAGGLGDPDLSVRQAALDLLANRRDPAAVAVLVGQLLDPEARPAALAALCRPVEGRVAGILQALAEAPEPIAPWLTSALARLQHQEGHLALVRALELPSVAARRAAAATLGGIGTPAALSALSRISTTDADPEVRRIAALALGR